ncbi:MAG: efflux RND transporter periplasmic adaptor subunit [Nitrospirota bacterium]
MRRMSIVIAILFALVTGCTHKHKVEEEPLKEILKTTAWTSKTELFMEHEEFEAGKEAEVVLHLTHLSTFKPVTEGTVTLLFLPQSGDPFSIKIDKPEKPGIFKSKVAFKRAGEYSLKVLVQGRSFSDEIEVPDIDVVGKGHDHEKEHKHAEEHHEEEVSGGTITFLKEQQWTVDFKVEPIAKMTLAPAFTVMGELVPATNAESTVASPLSGVISASRALPYIGKRVQTGETLMLIEPPIQQEGGIGQLSASYAEAKSKVVLAQKEYERAKRLYEAKAAPKKRVEEAEIALDTAKASLNPLERSMANMKSNTSGNRFIVKAPMSGTIVEMDASAGKFVESGKPLMRIMNTSTLWLKAHIPATEIGKLKSIDTAVFTIQGIDEEFSPRRIVTESDMVDPKTRTVAVIFEVGNPNNLLKAGMFTNVAIKTGRVESALTLSEEALFEDEGRYFVFVQHEGESFERREVRTGAKDRGYVHITDGLEEGERVVTKGGYYVKLASQSTKLPDEHAGHSH